MPTAIPQKPKTRLVNKYPPPVLKLEGKANPKRPNRNKIVPVIKL
jgi:hypothetical protein